MRPTRRKKKYRKKKNTRRRQHGGLTVLYKLGLGMPKKIPLDDRIKTIGDLKRFHREKGEAINVYGEDNENLEDGETRVTRVSTFFSPEQLTHEILTDERQDFMLLSRGQKKFAASVNGGGGSYPPFASLHSYTAEERQEFFDRMGAQLGFTVGYEPVFGTLYDIDASKNLLDIFHAQGLITDVDDIDRLFREDQSNNQDKMLFIHILFGEIKMPSKEPLTQWQTIHFDTLSPDIQELITTFYSIFDT